ncbi:hypothetical protein K505DRAFT_244420 [Melanomma pulvis-pyrius CBS 109.77]|uniref:DUF8021 domain-containing protein n=1 Tax=Melanomma pulvis-pyrius CBS 109.77 TaxID=1314802 RepID=A0A6A6XA71_9PLEO|nr:hypothetical protein K505DRAFT_244420 [Melanomma pulvis-pyrius CBS 109.77]
MKLNLQIQFATPWLLLALGFSQAQATGCDRPCLENLLSSYLTALVAHDPSRLPTSPDVKYVENSQILPLGTGMWKIADTLGKYRHVFADPESNQVGAITTLNENGVSVIYVVRIALDQHRNIREIETQITRDAVGAGRYEKMVQPEAVWLESVPPAQRISRAMLIAQTNKYYTGMERNDPKGNYSFFDKDCDRLEDGLQTTNQKNGDPYGHSNDTSFASLGCEAQFQTGFLGFVTKIRDRRYPVVDEERQAVFAITIFDHNGTVRELPSVNGTSSPIPPYFDVPRTLAATEAFRLRGEKLFRIEMTLTEVPYGMRSAFLADTPVQIGMANSHITNSKSCDRSCLDKILDQVLQAILNNNTSSLSLANEVRYSENGQFLPLGDGLWETVGSISKPGVDDYAARFSDPETGTVAYWGITKEQTTLGVLALRIKVDNGSITEIEAIDVRAESTGLRGGTMTLMRPPLPIEWEGTSLGQLDPVFKQNSSGFGTTSLPLVNAYLNGLEKHSSIGVHFDSSCTRRDNGFRGNLSCSAQMDGKGDSPNGLFNLTTAVRDRRILVTDSRKGVVIAVAMIDNPALSPSSLPATQMVPSTYMVPQLIKIENGTISRVESMVKWMPFGYTSAWTEGI